MGLSAKPQGAGCTLRTFSVCHTKRVFNKHDHATGHTKANIFQDRAFMHSGFLPIIAGITECEEYVGRWLVIDHKKGCNAEMQWMHGFDAVVCL